MGLRRNGLNDELSRVDPGVEAGEAWEVKKEKSP
jgi:hypothetical protein